MLPNLSVLSLAAACIATAVQALPASSAPPTPSLAPNATAAATPSSVPSSGAASVSVASGEALAQELLSEPSVVERFKKLLTDGNDNLLPDDLLRQRLVFDYNQQTPKPGAKGGSILLATIENWPVLTNLNIANAVSFFGPCGLNIPHSHPRANEVLTVVEGTLHTGFVLENGFTAQVSTELNRYQATVFPQGSIHFQQNPTCENATFVAALNSDDPGRSDIATNFFAFDGKIVEAALGFPTEINGDNIEQWRSRIPPNLALGVDACLQKCSLRPKA